MGFPGRSSAGIPRADPTFRETPGLGFATPTGCAPSDDTSTT